MTSNFAAGRVWPDSSGVACVESRRPRGRTSPVSLSTGVGRPRGQVGRTSTSAVGATGSGSTAPFNDNNKEGHTWPR
jgi:hypothetical protein